MGLQRTLVLALASQYDHVMNMAADGEITDLRTWTPGPIVALCVLIVIVGYLCWRLGFNYGTHQSNDLVLMKPEGSSEAGHLRAQLERVMHLVGLGDGK